MRCLLINDSGCIFDEATFPNVKSAREWAKGRGGEYTLKILDDAAEYLICRFKVRNDRFYKGDTE